MSGRIRVLLVIVTLLTAAVATLAFLDGALGRGWRSALAGDEGAPAVPAPPASGAAADSADGGIPRALPNGGPGGATGPEASGRRVRVEVLNASGRSGMARRAMDHLRQAGFDVVYYGNARESRRERTAVLDRLGDSALAAGVVAALGAGEVESRPDPRLELEVTVLLGQDWPPPPAPDASELPPRRLWRRLLNR